MSKEMVISHKQGATFDYTLGALGDENWDFSGLTVTAQARESSGNRKLVCDFTISETPVGYRVFASSQETANWPACHSLDVDFRMVSSDGSVDYTGTFKINVVRGVTDA